MELHNELRGATVVGVLWADRFARDITALTLLGRGGHVHVIQAADGKALKITRSSDGKGGEQED